MVVVIGTSNSSCRKDVEANPATGDVGTADGGRRGILAPGSGGHCGKWYGSRREEGGGEDRG